MGDTPEGVNMKREILFRGKRIDNGVLVYGHLLYQKSCLGTILDCVIVQDWVQLKEETVINVGYEVFPETLGQYTGLKDKNGKM